jgi:2-oxoglutarate ferredoxin oxidoreductase subunit alpha
MSKPMRATNDFVVRFANVNGSGSASANRLFARAIMRMGVPIASRNIFPSNIQGLPTWYEVRVCEEGWRGRRGGVDLMVAMNPQTWDQDVASIDPGGYLLYDSTRALPTSRFREGVTAIGVPLTELCTQRFSDPKQRQLFKNIAYVGVLAALLDLDLAVVEALLGEQFKGKDRLIAPNVEALRLGFDHARDHLGDACGLKVRPADRVGERIFIDGNDAAALGCVYGGATVAAWYPITPSTSMAEAFARHCRRFRTDPTSGKSRFAIIQAEDELAAIGIVIGAAWNGSRAFTATSGPGISLMQEFIGLAYFAEIPAVIFDIQRAGPSTGMPTRTQQADILACAYASHGDTRHVLLLPEDPRECFEMAADALDLADRLQTPVFVLSDLDVGMNEWLCEPLAWDDRRRYDRGKVMTFEDLEAGREFGRYLDVDGDGIAARSLPGVHPKGAYFVRGSGHDKHGAYTEDAAEYQEVVDRLARKLKTAEEAVPAPEIHQRKGMPSSVGLVALGGTHAAMLEACDALARDGIDVDYMRIKAFPFGGAVRQFLESHETLFVVEQNRDAQLRSLLAIETGTPRDRMTALLDYGGLPLTADFVTAEVARHLEVRVA